MTNVYLLSDLGLDFGSRITCVVVRINKIRSMRQIGYAKWYRDRPDSHIVSGNDCFYASCGGGIITQIGQAVSIHIFICHRIDAVYHQDRGEWEDIVSCIVQVLQIQNLL